MGKSASLPVYFLTVGILRGLSWFRVWVTSLEWSNPPLKESLRREMGVTRAEQVQLVRQDVCWDGKRQTNLM